MEKKYYLFKMGTGVIYGLSMILLAVVAGIGYLIFGNNFLNVLKDNSTIIFILYVPYLILHELLHSIAYVIYGGSFKKVTYGAHIEKGVLCCLCKQNITKKNVLHALLYPFFFIGVVTLAIGIIIDCPVLTILSLLNIAGCSGDFVMFYHLAKLKNFEFSEYNDPIAFGLYTDQDFSKLKMLGLEYVEARKELKRDDLRKVVISKQTIIFTIVYYIIMIINLIGQK